jgi:hypothetical protein
MQLDARLWANLLGEGRSIIGALGKERMNLHQNTYYGMKQTIIKLW